MRDPVQWTREQSSRRLVVTTGVKHDLTISESMLFAFNKAFLSLMSLSLVGDRLYARMQPLAHPLVSLPLSLFSHANRNLVQER